MNGCLASRDNWGCRDTNLCGKDTRSVKKIPGLAGQVRVGAPDASLTPASGVVAVAELVGRLGVTAALDDAVGSIKLAGQMPGEPVVGGDAPAGAEQRVPHPGVCQRRHVRQLPLAK